MEKVKKNYIKKFLTTIEYVGNKLPHPVTIFIILSVVIMIVSEIAYRMGLSIEYLGVKDGKSAMVTVKALSLLNADGIKVMFSKAVTNFTSFPPLGTVLVAMLGIGVADATGFIGSALKSLVLKTPKGLISAVVVFAGIMSNIASDVGYVILIPLSAMMFLSMGRHPLAGLAAAFAGVSGGFSANLLIGTLDPLLSGISTSAAQIIDPSYVVIPTTNIYFLAASVPFLTVMGALITDKLVEPVLGPYRGVRAEAGMEVTALEKKALNASYISALIYLIIMAFLVVPSNGALRGPNGEFLKSPFIQSIVPVMALFFFIPGVVYGIVAKKLKNDSDVIHAMSKSIATMGTYIVLAFFASQFIYYFSYTKLGTILAVSGANFLESTGFTGITLIISFVILTCLVNLFMGSASAKWAIMAPIFIPMLMQIGYTPDFVQLAYRIGDSSTNIISPLMSYFAMIIAFAQKYDVEGEEPSGLGTIISMMLPYSIIFLVFWSILLIIWFTLGLPIGIGGTIRL